MIGLQAAKWGCMKSKFAHRFIGHTAALKPLLSVSGLAILLFVAPIMHAANKTSVTGASDRGREIFKTSCAACHGAALQGAAGPPLVGGSFRSKWSRQAPAALGAYVRKMMPLGAPGSLSDVAYTDVVAFILQQNDGAKQTTQPAAKAGKTKRSSGK